MEYHVQVDGTILERLIHDARITIQAIPQNECITPVCLIRAVLQAILRQPYLTTTLTLNREYLYAYVEKAVTRLLFVCTHKGITHEVTSQTTTLVSTKILYKIVDLVMDAAQGQLVPEPVEEPATCCLSLRK